MDDFIHDAVDFSYCNVTPMMHKQKVQAKHTYICNRTSSD
jgi:hypothetical protein